MTLQGCCKSVAPLVQGHKTFAGDIKVVPLPCVLLVVSQSSRPPLTSSYKMRRTAASAPRSWGRWWGCWARTPHQRSCRRWLTRWMKTVNQKQCRDAEQQTQWLLDWLLTSSPPRSRWRLYHCTIIARDKCSSNALNWTSNDSQGCYMLYVIYIKMCRDELKVMMQTSSSEEIKYLFDKTSMHVIFRPIYNKHNLNVGIAFVWKDLSINWWAIAGFNSVLIHYIHRVFKENTGVLVVE